MSEGSAQPRQLAVDVCYQVLVKGASLTESLESQLSNIESDRDRGLCSELCYGFCRYYFVLDTILNKRLQKPLKRRDIDVEIILILGLYQIRFMRVSDHAAVNESVKLLRKIGKNWAKGLVNAVLRSYIRDNEKTPDLSSLSETEHVSAYPEWMQKKLASDWSEKAEQIFAAGNQQAPMVLRVDDNKITQEDVLQQLADQEMKARPHEIVSNAIVLLQPVAVDRLPGFAEGLLSVQDAAAQLAAQVLECQSGMRVLDACAAPGGKTLHILQSSPNLQVVALDKDAHRLHRVNENLTRGNASAQVICADAATTEDWFDGTQFDRILLDAPCSASGIIRRHPDIRLLRKAGDVGSLAKQQWDLLNALWPLLKEGGRMVYSTCSIFKDENEHQIERFIQSQDNCVEQPLNEVQWGESRPYGRQILPGFDDMDGFYYACLVKPCSTKETKESHEDL